MKQQGKDIGLCLCKVCRQLNSSDLTHCQRFVKLSCRSGLFQPAKSWALLITAAILLVPANIYPITMLTNQGASAARHPFFGHFASSAFRYVAHCRDSFTASILVPWIKNHRLIHLSVCDQL